MDDAPQGPGQTFGQLLRERRRADQLTVRKISELSGVSTATVDRWLRGDVEHPKPQQLRAVCEATRIDPHTALVALGYLDPDVCRAA